MFYFVYILKSVQFFVCLNPGEQENIDKFTKRLVKVTKQHNDECKKLLTLMGVPYVEVRSVLTLLQPFMSLIIVLFKLTATVLRNLRLHAWQQLLFFPVREINCNRISVGE